MFVQSGKGLSGIGKISRVMLCQEEVDAGIVGSAADACRAVLGECVVAGVPFATDGSSFAELGVPTIVLGPGSIDRAHGAVEWVECEQVLQASEIYQRIMVTQGPSDEA